MMNDYYFYAQIAGEIPNTVARIVIGKIHPSPFEGQILVGNAYISLSQLLSLQSIPREVVEEIFSLLIEDVSSCPDPTSKKCMDSLKKKVKRFFELTKEPSYVIVTESPMFGKVIDIIFTQGLE